MRLRRLVGDGLPGVQGLSHRAAAGAAAARPGGRRRTLGRPGAAGRAGGCRRTYGAGHRRGEQAAGQLVVRRRCHGRRAAARGGTQKSGSLALGISINIPLLTPGRWAGVSDAARKRAQAALLQRDEALEARRYRVAEVYEQTQASFDRARRVGAVLRDSEQVRNFTLQQWQQLGRRSLFDVMGAEAEHYNLRVSHVNALHDGQQLNAILLSLGRGVGEWLR